MTTMRRNAALVVAVALAASLAGCNQKVYLQEIDAKPTAEAPGLPTDLENRPHASILPSERNTPAPSHVGDPDRPIRYISLAEAIAIALEQGNIGSQSALFPASSTTTCCSLMGDSSAQAIRFACSRSIRPSVARTSRRRSPSSIARWITSLTWNKRDDSVGNILTSFQNGDNATFNSGLYKFLPTGGLAGVTFNMDYNLLTTPPSGGQVLTNPGYRPRAQIVFEQPLWQDFGVEINQLLVNHPGAIFRQWCSLTRRRPGRRRANRSASLRPVPHRIRAANINFMMLNVEYAYWNLYSGYFTLFSREQGLHQAFEAYKLNEARLRAGTLKEQDLQQTRAQSEQFRPALNASPHLVRYSIANDNYADSWRCPWTMARDLVERHSDLGGVQTGLVVGLAGIDGLSAGTGVGSPEPQIPAARYDCPKEQLEAGLALLRQL